MLIKALCDYYDVLKKTGKVLPEGYSRVPIRYLVCLSADGKIDGIINWQNKVQAEGKNGKVTEKYVPREELLFQRTQKPGIESNVIEHRPLYIFGLNLGKDGFHTEDGTGKAKKSHEAFVTCNLSFVEGIESPVVNAYRAFLLNWKPEGEIHNPYLAELGNNYKNSGFAFCLTGHPELLLHRDEALKEKWEECRKSDDSGADGVVSQCGISGEQAPIARIHNKIKGIYGGAATGNVFICFKNASENSYGNDQSYNSNVSEAVMKKYTESLNYLLNGRNHKTRLDDITVVFWAMCENESSNDLMSALLFGSSDRMSAEQTEDMLKDLMEDAKEGKILTERISSQEYIDPDVDFYMLGLKPNSSRVSVKFFYRKKFADILWNIAAHQNDLQISEKRKPIPLWRIGKELISPKSSVDTVNPALMTKIFKSILYGSDYPQLLFAAVVERVKTDRSVNEIRAGIIKACINREQRNSQKKEELNVGLDKSNKQPAYLCGRLFAVLEKLQEEAIEERPDRKLDRTIKDAYFASAVSKPAMVFPKLLRLAQHHLKKYDSVKKQYKRNFNRLIGEIVDGMESDFPNLLSLEEQGTFIIGYYQQLRFFYTGHSEQTTMEEEEN